jgi:hypothetical protein
MRNVLHFKEWLGVLERKTMRSKCADLKTDKEGRRKLAQRAKGIGTVPPDTTRQHGLDEV